MFKFTRRRRQTSEKSQSVTSARWVVRSSEAKPLRFSSATVERLKREAAERDEQLAAG